MRECVFEAFVGDWAAAADGFRFGDDDAAASFGLEPV
jgi:hypothetical protein